MGHRVGCQHGNARAWAVWGDKPALTRKLGDSRSFCCCSQQLERVGVITSAGPYRDLEVEVDYFELPTEIRDALPVLPDLLRKPPLSDLDRLFGASTPGEKTPHGTPIYPLRMLSFEPLQGSWRVGQSVNLSHVLDLFIRMPQRTQDLIRFLNGKPFWNARLKPRGASSISVCNPSSFWVNQWSLGLRREQRIRGTLAADAPSLVLKSAPDTAILPYTGGVS